MALEQPTENLFESSRMTFGEHLEELRKVLVRAVIGIALGCVVGFYYANQTVEFLTKPLTNAIGQFHVQQAEKRLVAENGFMDPESTPWLKQDNMAPETVYVDPGEFVHLLRQLSPDFLSGIELHPYGFQAAHFNADRLPELCRRLSQQTALTEAGKARLLWLWDQLDSSQQRTVIQIAASPDGTSQDVQDHDQNF